MAFFAHYFSTPLGKVFTAVNEAALVHSLLFVNHEDRRKISDHLPGEIIWSARECHDVERQVGEYLDGKRQRFSLAVAPHGSDFQLLVWRQVRGIPFGETRSYGQIAQQLGRKGAARAVGRANATNPVCLLTPCHRVIGADGSLTGFGGGLAIKRALLDLESRPLQADLFPPG